MPTATESIAAEFHADLGSDLRLVARYDADALEVLYVREDVAERRTDPEYETLHEELLRENRTGAALADEFGSRPGTPSRARTAARPVSTPLAGPDSPFYCLDCDSAFT